MHCKFKSLQVALVRKSFLHGSITNIHTYTSPVFPPSDLRFSTASLLAELCSAGAESRDVDLLKLSFRVTSKRRRLDGTLPEDPSCTMAVSAGAIAVIPKDAEDDDVGIIMDRTGNCELVTDVSEWSAALTVIILESEGLPATIPLDWSAWAN